MMFRHLLCACALWALSAVPAQAEKVRLNLIRVIAPDGANGAWTVAAQPGDRLLIVNSTQPQGLLINALPRADMPVDLTKPWRLSAKLTIDSDDPQNAALGLAYLIDARQRLSSFALVKADGQAALLDYNGQALEPRLLTPLGLTDGKSADIAVQVTPPPADAGAEGRWLVAFTVNGHDAGALARTVEGDLGIVAMGRGRFTLSDLIIEASPSRHEQTATAEP